MSFWKDLRTFFGKKNEMPEIDLEIYANMPLFQMSENDIPFNDWRSPEANIPDGLEDLFRISVWMYQMYAFYILTGDRFGQEIADRVLRFQVERISKLSEEMGQQLQAAIQQIHRIVTHPFVAEVKGQKVEMPVEYGIAMEFLTLGENAPYPLDVEKFQADESNMPDTNSAELSLMACLVHGREKALSYFTPMTNMKVILSGV